MTAIDATVAGRRVHLSGDAVLQAVADDVAEPITDHYAVIDGRCHPPKQEVALVTGRTVPVRLRTGADEWEAPVSISAARLEFDVEAT